MKQNLKEKGKYLQTLHEKRQMLMKNSFQSSHCHLKLYQFAHSAAILIDKWNVTQMVSCKHFFLKDSCKHFIMRNFKYRIENKLELNFILLKIIKERCQNTSSLEEKDCKVLSKSGISTLVFTGCCAGNVHNRPVTLALISLSLSLYLMAFGAVLVTCTSTKLHDGH